MSVESATPGTYTPIAAVRDVGGPNIQTDAVDFTSRDTSWWKEFIAGLIDGGEVEFDVLYDPDAATHGTTGIGLMALALARTTKNWRITLSDATPTTWTFSGFIKNFKPKAPMKDAFTAAITVKVSGAITVA